MTRLTPHRPLVSAVILLAVVTLTGCAGASRASQAPAPQPEFQMGLEGAIARARADSLRYPYTQADIDFMSGMIHHHAQAIQMSRWASTHGARADVQLLAERIINAQQGEISLMQAWLQDRRQPVPEPNPMGMTMGHGATAHTMLMPGMLTAEQMAQLDAARGEEFDQLFLDFMIQHHRGAVGMVDELFSHRGAGQDESVFKFASDVQVDQATEIRRMLQMLIESPPSSSQGSR
ncbi:MAG TPA: DUF305 domain-containing protein [Gemmatimonadaceae bacterium]|nr:DUF305 domain-containing protein [Gemmatimonadaceae bacterium]